MNPCSNCFKWIQGVEWLYLSDRREQKCVSTDALISVYKLTHLCSSESSFTVCVSLSRVISLRPLGVVELGRVPLSALVDLTEHMVSPALLFSYGLLTVYHVCCKYSANVPALQRALEFVGPNPESSIFCEILFMFLLCILSQLRCKLIFLYPELQDIDWIDSQLNDSHGFGHWADWKLSSEAAEVDLSSIHVSIKGWVRLSASSHLNWTQN